MDVEYNHKEWGIHKCFIMTNNIANPDPNPNPSATNMHAYEHLVNGSKIKCKWIFVLESKKQGIK